VAGAAVDRAVPEIGEDVIVAGTGVDHGEAVALDMPKRPRKLVSHVMNAVANPAPAQPWAAINPPVTSAAQRALINAGVSEALLTVEKVRSRLPSWQRMLGAAATEASSSRPDWANVEALIDLVGTSPARAADAFAARDRASSDAPQQELHLLSAQLLLGSHAQLLVQRLREAAEWVGHARNSATASDPERVEKYLQQALAALSAAMQHTLFLTMLGDLRAAHVGESRSLHDYCSGWGLSAAQVDTLWTWLTNDARRFGGEDLPVALDTQNHLVYRLADSQPMRWLTASAVILGFGLVFGVVVLLFAVLHSAGLTQWPANWGWKMIVLLLFVTLGAVTHLGSRVLNVNYDNPMKVYDAGNIINWLSLRWVAVIQMYIPIVVVASALWGAGNIPTSFQKLGAAILAGYSADSLVRAAASKLQSQAAGRQAAANTPALASGAEAATRVAAGS
jgi:hypothetical protein